jgi:hypothetical protein
MKFFGCCPFTGLLANSLTLRPCFVVSENPVGSEWEYGMHGLLKLHRFSTVSFLDEFLTQNIDDPGDLTFFHLAFLGL